MVRASAARPTLLARWWVVSLAAAGGLILAAAWVLTDSPGLISEAEALREANLLLPELEGRADRIMTGLAEGRARLEASFEFELGPQQELLRPKPMAVGRTIEDAPADAAVPMASPTERAAPTPAASLLSAALRQADLDLANDALQTLEQARAALEPHEVAIALHIELNRARQLNQLQRYEQALQTLEPLLEHAADRVLDRYPVRLTIRKLRLELWKRLDQPDALNAEQEALRNELLAGAIPMAIAQLRFELQQLTPQPEGGENSERELEQRIQELELANRLRRALAGWDGDGLAFAFEDQWIFVRRDRRGGAVYPADACRADFVRRLRELLPEHGAFELVAPGDERPLPRLLNPEFAKVIGRGWSLGLARPEVFARPIEQRRLFIWAASAIVVLALAGIAVIGHRALHRRAELERLRSEFVAGVSHELRTPAASIALLAENLREGRVTTPERQREYFDALRRDANRLQRMVADVLDVSRLERGALTVAPRATDPVELLDRIVEEYRPRLQGVGLRLEWEGLADAIEVPQVELDPDAVERCLGNLLDNASKYAVSGSYVRLGLSLGGEAWTIEVEDDGPGIPAAERERLLRPFERGMGSDRLSAGAGLGLALVHATMAAHRGELRIESSSARDGTGCRFRLSFPAPSPQSESKA